VTPHTPEPSTAQALDLTHHDSTKASVRVTIATTPDTENIEVQLAEERAIEVLIQATTVPVQNEEVALLREALTMSRLALHVPGKPLRATDLVEHEIQIQEGARPPYIRQYKSSFAEEQRMREITLELLNDGMIQPSRSPSNSPWMLVKKSNGEDRPVIDFRGLNAITIPDRYPMLRTDVALFTLNGMRVFSTLDLKQGFWQIPIKKSDREKTAFTVPGLGHYEWMRLPFGLINSPATFCRLVNTLLGTQAQLRSGEMVVSVAQAYVDDIIIASKTVTNHIQHLGNIFDLINKAQLTINAAKCYLLRREIKFLGHIVGQDGITTDPEKIRKIVEWPTPTNITEVQQFIGFANFYRKFIKDFSVISQPLRDLTLRGQTFHWNQTAQTSFQTLKEKFTSPTILAYPDMTSPFIIYTDASYNGLGYSLHQLQEDHSEQPIAFAGRALTKAEKLYEVTELECLGLVEAVRYFHEYVWDLPITIYTDHSALVSMMKKKETRNRKLRTGMLALQTYNIEIRYKSGAVMTHVDALSRYPTYGEPELSLADKVYSIKVADSPWVKAQQEDEWCKGIIDTLTKKTNENTKENQLCRQYQLSDGILMKLSPGGDTRLVVPLASREKVLVETHDHSLAGHLGQQKTYEKLARTFYWPAMYEDMVHHIRSCLSCQRFKSPPQLLPHVTPSSITKNVNQAMQSINIDIKGPIHPRTIRGNQYILIITDVATRWVEAFAMPNQRAETVAKYFVEGFICRFGCPLEMSSDRGTNFLSDLLTQVNSVLQINHRLSAPYSPWVNGCVERVNATIMQILSHYTDTHADIWDDLMYFALYAYRTSQHSVTKVSPYQLMFGRQPHGPSEANLDPWEPTMKQGKEAAEELQALLHKAFEILKATKSDATENTTILPEEPASITTGDYVWVKSHQDRTTSEAIRPHWQGPFEVLTSTPHTLQLKNCYTGKTTTAHLKSVKKFIGPPPNMRFQPYKRPTAVEQHPDTMEQRTNGRSDPKPLQTNIELDDTPLTSNEFEVEEILSERQDQHGKSEFLVKWQGYPESANTWEPYQNFINKNGAKTLALIEWERAGKTEGIYQIMWGLEETNMRYHRCPSNLGRPAGTAAKRGGSMSHQ